VLRDVLDEFAEVFITRDKVCLAVDFHQDAEFAAVVDVAGDTAFVGCASRFLAGDRDALLRRIFSASARSPLASCRATLQSIMPAPVLSRSSFTTLESIACMVVVVILILAP